MSADQERLGVVHVRPAEVGAGGYLDVLAETRLIPGEDVFGDHAKHMTRALAAAAGDMVVDYSVPSTDGVLNARVDEPPICVYSPRHGGFVVPTQRLDTD